MPFLDKINTTMKKSKLTKRKKPKAAAATKEIDISDESELSAMMKSHHIDKDQDKTSENLADPAVNNVVEQNRNEEMETELRNIRDENQYLKLLLGMSYKVDQLYEIWHGHFPNAFSSKNNLKTYLDLHSKQKQSDLIVKTFEHVQTIKQFLTEHKIQMIAPGGSEQISNNSENVLGMGRNSSELLESGHSGAQESIVDNASTSSTGDQRKAEISSNSQQRQDLGRMLSQEGPIQINIMCHCKGMCLKGCICRSEGVSCTVRCGCLREKCQLRSLEKPPVIEENDDEDSSTDKENNEENEEPRANIAPIMKSKRIVVPMKTVPVQEAADMEMSFATKKNLNKVKVAKKKVETFKKPLDPSPDVTIDCSILAPRPENRNHVFSTPVYQKFKTNHIRNASDSH